MGRIRYLPVTVELDGLRDDSIGPYIKGRVQMVDADYNRNGSIFSISESCLLDPEQIEDDIREEIAREIESFKFGHSGYCASSEVGICTCEVTKKREVARLLAFNVRNKR